MQTCLKKRQEEANNLFWIYSLKKKIYISLSLYHKMDAKLILLLSIVSCNKRTHFPSQATLTELIFLYCISRIVEIAHLVYLLINF